MQGPKESKNKLDVEKKVGRLTLPDLKIDGKVKLNKCGIGERK